jgi:hypothetical protein
MPSSALPDAGASSIPSADVDDELSIAPRHDELFRATASPNRNGRRRGAGRPAGLRPRGALDEGGNPPLEGRGGGNVVVRDMCYRKHGHGERRRRDCRDLTCGTGPARMLMTRLVAGNIRRRETRITMRLCRWLGGRRRHACLVAVIHRFSACVGKRCIMRHRTGQLDRGRDALHRQRREQYPHHDGSDQRAHVNQSNMRKKDMDTRYGVATSCVAGPFFRERRADRSGIPGMFAYARIAR